MLLFKSCFVLFPRNLHAFSQFSFNRIREQKPPFLTFFFTQLFCSQINVNLLNSFWFTLMIFSSVELTGIKGTVIFLASCQKSILCSYMDTHVYQCHRCNDANILYTCNSACLYLTVSHTFQWELCMNPYQQLHDQSNVTD